MNSTEIIEVIAEVKVGNFEITSLVLATAIGVVTIIITYFFFSAVNEQVKQGKKILEYHDKEYARNGKRITFEIADEFIKEHDKASIALVANIEKDKISMADRHNITILLERIEMLAIKYNSLSLDLDVLDECLGLTIMPILDNTTVQKIKNDEKAQSKTDGLYTQLEKFYPLLKEIRKKKYP